MTGVRVRARCRCRGRAIWLAVPGPVQAHNDFFDDSRRIYGPNFFQNLLNNEYNLQFMKTKTLAVFALAAGGIIASAQTNQPTDDWKPSLSNMPGQDFPQVNSEGRVRARLRAPDAQNVELNISGVKFPMGDYSSGMVLLNR